MALRTVNSAHFHRPKQPTPCGAKGSHFHRPARLVSLYEVRHVTKPANLITNEHVKRRIVLKKGNIGGDKTILDSVSISFLSKLSKLNLDYSCQVNTNGLQKSTSPTSAVALCWSSWRAQRTVIWFNSAPLKSHPGSIIIRLLVLAPQSGQSKVNPKADLSGTNLTSFMNTTLNPPVSIWWQPCSFLNFDVDR